MRPAASIASPTDGPAPTARNYSIGKAVGRGFSWLTFSLLAGKAFGALAQLALGRWITDVQFRDFAIVASVAALVKVFQDGGVPQVLIQRGSAEFDRLVGPAFWLSALIGLIGGTALAAASPFIADAYDSRVLLGALLVVALTLVVGAPTTVMRAKLRVDLRFQAIAVIAVFWFFLRHASAVGFAAVGFGVIGLVLPLLLVALYEAAATYWVIRMKPWRSPPGFHEWPSLLGNSFWVVATAVCRGLSRTGDYLVLGLVASAGTTGRYFFGYQITTQVVELLATNLQHVLFPALSKMADEPERQSRAVLRTIRMLVFVAAPTSLILAVTISPIVTILDEIIWNHKWSDAIPLMQIFAVAAPIRMFSDVLTASLSSRRRFRDAALLTLAEGLWLMMAAWLAVEVYGSSLTHIAAVVASLQAIFSVGSSMLLLRSFEIRPAAFLAAFAPSWLTAVAAAGIAATTLHLTADGAPPLVQLAISGVVFAASFAAMARILLRSHIEELVRVVPRPAAKMIQRVMLLPDGPGA